MKRKILVVDDDHDMVQTLCDIFRLCGWEPRGVHSGEDAVTVSCDERPSAVLMDVRMPGMDGLAALKEIKRRAPDIRVILMTAQSPADVMDEAERGGAARVIPKPIDFTELMPLLN